MLKISPSARLRVATSSISVSLSATTFTRTTSSTGAPVSSTMTSAPATPVRSSMMSCRNPRRRVTVLTRPTFASGFSTASSVTRKLSATGRPLTSCFKNAYSSCVTLPRRHSRSHVVGATCARVVTPDAHPISSSPTIALFMIRYGRRLSPERPVDRLALPREEHRALLGDVKTILEADPELAVDRDRRLVAETHPGLEPRGVAPHEVRPLVAVEADAVAGAVREARQFVAWAEAGLGDQTACRGVDRLARRSRLRGFERRTLSALLDLPHIA